MAPRWQKCSQEGMTELGEIYSCSQILCWTTGCRPYHSAVRITRFALTCTVFVTATEVTGHHQHYFQLPQSASAKAVCNHSWAKPTDQHREGGTTHCGGETVQTEPFTRFPALEEWVNKNIRNRIQSSPWARRLLAVPPHPVRTHTMEPTYANHTARYTNARTHGPRTGRTRYGLLLSFQRHDTRREHQGNRLYIHRGTT